MEEQKQGGALPFATETGFTSLPNAVCLHYVKHPWFNPSVERLYRYLLMRHNPNYGYAFPSWNAIVSETHLSRGSVKTGLDVLEHMGLINRRDHANPGDWSNKIYTFNRPIENEEEFQRKYGQEMADIKSKKIKKVAYLAERLGKETREKPAEVVDEPVGLDNFRW